MGTKSTSSVASSRGVSDEGRNVAAEQLAAVILSEDETYIQSLLLREVAVALDATMRDSLAQLRQMMPPLPVQTEPFAALFNPIARPLELIQATLELQNVDARDAQRLENVRILTDLARRAGGRSENPVGAGDISSLARQVAARRTALARIGARFSSTLAATQAERLRQRGRNSSGVVSPLAGRLAVDGAQRLDLIAETIASLERTFAANDATSNN